MAANVALRNNLRTSVGRTVARAFGTDLKLAEVFLCATFTNLFTWMFFQGGRCCEL
jgi:hypothetical protein